MIAATITTVLPHGDRRTRERRRRKLRDYAGAERRRTERRTMNLSHSPPTIAVLIHDHLVRSGMTEVELAEMVGVDQAQISRWRRGAAVPRVAAVAELAAALELDPGDVETARGESLRVRDRSAKLAPTPREELADLRAELRKARAKIARLEQKLRRRDR